MTLMSMTLTNYCQLLNRSSVIWIVEHILLSVVEVVRARLRQRWQLTRVCCVQLRKKRCQVNCKSVCQNCLSSVSSSIINMWTAMIQCCCN